MSARAAAAVLIAAAACLVGGGYLVGGTKLCGAMLMVVGLAAALSVLSTTARTDRRPPRPAKLTDSHGGVWPVPVTAQVPKMPETPPSESGASSPKAGGIR